MNIPVQARKEQILASISFVSSHELAIAAGYAGVCDGFRNWCHEYGITPVPGRKSHFDPKLVRLRLDQIQGLQETKANEHTANAEPVSLVEQRRARRVAR
ncbi:hypothetical protein RSK20926_02162 [Roseobacter sp. SK209-2-6]|nr:hypothetical protein RSK20926_02162 [Roseobacter sp. SK209-2-6]